MLYIYERIYTLIYSDLLHLLENTFDRKCISANLSPNPNLNFDPNPKAQ